LELDDKTLLQSTAPYKRYLTVVGREEGYLAVKTSDGYSIDGKSNLRLGHGLYPIVSGHCVCGYLFYCPPFLHTDVWPTSLSFYTMLHFRIVKCTDELVESPVIISKSMIADVRAALTKFGVDVAHKQGGGLRVVSVSAGLSLLGLVAPPDTEFPNDAGDEEPPPLIDDPEEKTHDSDDDQLCAIQILSDRLAEVEETNGTLTRNLENAENRVTSQLLKIKRQSEEIQRLRVANSALAYQREEIQRLKGVNAALVSQQEAWTSGFCPDTAGLRKIAAKFASMVDKTCGKMADKDMCILCMEKPRNMAMQPCGHLCCCVDCSSTLRAQTNPKCPVCRGEFKDAVRVFT
jgi:hypothetical protein